MSKERWVRAALAMFIAPWAGAIVVLVTGVMAPLWSSESSGLLGKQVLALVKIELVLSYIAISVLGLPLHWLLIAVNERRAVSYVGGGMVLFGGVLSAVIAVSSGWAGLLSLYASPGFWILFMVPAAAVSWTAWYVAVGAGS